MQTNNNVKTKTDSSDRPASYKNSRKPATGEEQFKTFVFVHSVLTVNGKSRSGEELFCKHFVNVNIILNFQTEMHIPLKPIPKKGSLRR